MKTQIKNGQILTAVDAYKADILFEGKTISVIGKNLEMKGDKTIEVS